MNTPSIDPHARIAPNASIVGDVNIEANVSVWFGAVIRGDTGHIHIGRGAVVEDNVTIHGEVSVGERVVIGHNAIVHGCTLESDCLVGMGAIVMNNAKVGEGALVAAGALVSEGTTIPAGHLAMGVPAEDKGLLSEANKETVARNPTTYARLAQEELPLWEELQDSASKD